MTRNFGDVCAVDHLDLRVERGTVFALLGPNGAGKTTTIEMCEGFSEPSAGEVRVLGLDPVTDADAVRRRIGVMLQGGGAYPGIRVGEMLELTASYSARPLDPSWLLELVGLSRHSRTSYRRLSGGQQQRLSLACALVGRPELVFLDEPTAGMDTQSRLAVWELVNSLRRDGVTVVLTTHLMDEAEALADHVMIIDRGVKVAEGSPGELTALTGAGAAQIRVDTSAQLDAGRFTASLVDGGYPEGVALTATRPLSYRVRARPTPDLIAAIARAAADQEVLIRGLGIDHRSLEDVFLDITGREMRS
ncbi:ABC transporter ATP-binding protein [Corynebacterium sp. CCM 9187]|uniref:ABC transporter ATP-binding protein n=1 Tax=Corynebacterium pygosceleis TaxID=2800406 RepID=A0A9Q4C698_9CORY|nr:ABC transporter ATP-binding protein [Corynebacterium pygosceleis]MCK7637003.1 ABC transporter ATP-binding protein [Corynebacterium pygosceleis]MCK7674477.1 ABC transporter ATP-binding protein [Corynebacterium pygosceleis]MCL0120225.1 ABC transporter ATP-binding protein [Corynebacterium pygosceleis]MCX7443772.1 ABC transporter ATP-binding protein [Corynebacterium pygosceleis]MCX7467756.1 ABC transporter ATP-binding protein [Corynebacterium pygosceleis]